MVIIANSHTIDSGKPGTAIADTLGITQEAVSRWCQQPDFKAAVNALLLDAWDTLREHMQGLCTLALDTIEVSLQVCVKRLKLLE